MAVKVISMFPNAMGLFMYSTFILFARGWRKDLTYRVEAPALPKNT